MLTKTIIPKKGSTTINLIYSFTGENERLVATIEKDDDKISANNVDKIQKIYTKNPKVDLSSFNVDRIDANDYE